MDNLIIDAGKNFFKKQSPARLIALGFSGVILIGAILLMLPISANEGVHVSFIDALFTSASAVCVTGLITLDTADSFTIFGRTVVALLIQIGGLGVTSVGVGLVLATGKRLGFKGRLLVKEAMNVSNFKGLVKLVKYILLTTLVFESIGAALSFFVFVKQYPALDAIGISVFHSIASFNNAGFDILGGMQNLIPYEDSVLLNLTTAGLIIFGGIGFFVIMDIIGTKNFRKLTLHSKVVIVTSAVLILVGTVLLKATEDVTLMGAFFQSVSARTAGFCTYPIGEFTNAGLFTLIILMFIGASPGSTGGGIKTSTLFVIMNAIKSTATNQHCQAFRRKIPSDVIYRASIITMLSFIVVCISTFLLCVFEPQFSFIQLLFESTSAFGTVGLSTGITPNLSTISKIVIIITMFIGRLGALTMATVWVFKAPTMSVYTEEHITIG
ncbi:MAG: TrkH family potassium uptake protein [Aminipila sp.]